MVSSIFRKFCSALSLLAVCIVLIIIGCRSRKPVQVEKKITKQPVAHEVPTITVIVHGTRLFPKVALQERFFSASGMIKISELDSSYKTMHMIVDELSQRNPQRFNRDRFYAFGWEGELDFDSRLATAGAFYSALIDLANEYEKKYGVWPSFLLIGHSHGCNVILNLAAVKTMNNPLKIDIILLACPVQDETKHLIDDNLFGKKYALCSKGDLIQIIDPQGLQRKYKGHIFSERWFPPYKGVIQAKIKINGRAILHIEFIMQRFVKRLPEILDLMDAWYEAAKSKDNGIQQLPFPLIDLRAKSIRIGGRHNSHQ